MDWTYYRDNPSLRLLEEQPDHGCDLCSRYRRRAVYEIARDLGANVIAFGHTADDFCEALLRNALFTGRLSALPPITYSRDRQFRLIRPLVFCDRGYHPRLCRGARCAVNALRLFAADGHRAAVVTRAFRELEKEYPHLKENMLSAMGNVDTKRLLDPRLLDLETPEPFPILTEP